MNARDTLRERREALVEAAGLQRRLLGLETALLREACTPWRRGGSWLQQAVRVWRLWSAWRRRAGG